MFVVCLSLRQSPLLEVYTVSSRIHLEFLVFVFVTICNRTTKFLDTNFGMEMNNIILPSITNPAKRIKGNDQQEKPETEISPWEFLTTEILHHLFQYIPYDDLLTASLVCKIWRAVISMVRVSRFTNLLLVGEFLKKF